MEANTDVPLRPRGYKRTFIDTTLEIRQTDQSKKPKKRATVFCKECCAREVCSNCIELGAPCTNCRLELVAEGPVSEHAPRQLTCDCGQQGSLHLALDSLIPTNIMGNKQATHCTVTRSYDPSARILPAKSLMNSPRELLCLQPLVSIIH